MQKRFSSLTLSVSMLVVIVSVGVVGYMYLEKYSLVDAIFMTMITVSTVGFGEVQPLSPTGEVFTIFMILFSFGVFAYAVTSVTRFVVDGGFRHHFINKRTHRKVKGLYDHVIICGFGRNGSEAARVLRDKGEHLVVIDQSDEVIDEVRQAGFLYIQGDATEEEVLNQARISHAKSFITTIPNDAENLLVTLTAREMNSHLQIISRASHEWSDIKLKKAGANNVIMPDLVGGRRMAKLIASPELVDFMELLLHSDKQGVRLTELNCYDFAEQYQELCIQDLHLKDLSGVNVVGIKDEKGGYIFNPAMTFRLKPEYKLFVMGTQAQVNTLKRAIFERN